jgi:hypothetical protein
MAIDREQIIEMARKSGAGVLTSAMPLEHPWVFLPVELERFAALVAAAERKRSEQEMAMMSEHCAEQILMEREACAKVCEDDFGNGALNLAAAIRARGETK